MVTTTRAYRLHRCRFGHYLKTSLIQDWRVHYIDYAGLKDALKTAYETEPTPDRPKPNRKPWTDEDEERFVKQMEAELDKVFTFQRVKGQEIIRRIKQSEQEVNAVLERMKQHEGPNAGQNNNDTPTEEDFLLLEEDLSDIIADVYDLAKFTQLNYTGFQKIIKKHDVSFCLLSRIRANYELETNRLALETCLCCTVTSQTILQGRLRRVHHQVIKALRPSPDTRPSGQR